MFKVGDRVVVHIGYPYWSDGTVTPPTASEVNERLATEVDVRSYLEDHPFEPFVFAQGADGELGVFFAKDWAMFYGVPGVRYAGLL